MTRGNMLIFVQGTSANGGDSDGVREGENDPMPRTGQSEPGIWPDL